MFNCVRYFWIALLADASKRSIGMRWEPWTIIMAYGLAREDAQHTNSAHPLWRGIDCANNLLQPQSLE